MYLNMDKYLEVFEVLYDIKEKISDKQYIILNENFMELIKIAESYYDRSIHSEDYISEYTTESEDESSDSSEVEEIVSNDEPQASIPPIIITTQQTEDICRCTENDVCINTFDKFRKCSNLERFLEINPILRKLIDTNTIITLTKNPVEQNDEMRLFCINNVKLCLDFYSNTYLKIDQIIIISAIYDFLMKNIQFVKKHKNIRNCLLNKINEFSEEEEFHKFLRENDFSLEIWKNTFTFEN